MTDEMKKRLIGGLILLGVIIVLSVFIFGSKEPAWQEADKQIKRDNLAFEIDIPDQNGQSNRSGELNKGLNLEPPPQRTETASQSAEGDQYAGLRIDLPPPEPIAENIEFESRTRSEPVAQSKPDPEPVQVQKPAPKPKAAGSTESSQRPAPATPGGGWIVQAGSFSSEANAQKLKNKISALGYNCYITAATVQGATLKRVRIGPYDTEWAAKQAATRLQSQLKQPVKVMTNK